MIRARKWAKHSVLFGPRGGEKWNVVVGRNVFGSRCGLTQQAHMGVTLKMRVFVIAPATADTPKRSGTGSYTSSSADPTMSAEAWEHWRPSVDVVSRAAQ